MERMSGRLIRSGLAYVDVDRNVIDLTDEEAAFLLDQDSRVALEWRKWVRRAWRRPAPRGSASYAPGRSMREERVRR